MQIADACAFLEQFAPTELSEDWDNVGLLVGRKDQPLQAVMTCLTVTPASAAEAVEEGADLIVTHHPLPFHPLKRLTDECVAGRMLLDLVGAGVAVYSPHTAFDSARQGINQQLAELVGISAPQPLVESSLVPELGSGRWGPLADPAPLETVAARLCDALHLPGLLQVDAGVTTIRQAAVACGSAGQFLAAARAAGCDLLITGETSFHTCLEAEATRVSLLLPGHYASERFAVEQLARILADKFAGLRVWASTREQDPLRWIDRQAP